jgi:hypothetical protein
MMTISLWSSISDMIESVTIIPSSNCAKVLMIEPNEFNWPIVTDDF